VKEDGKQLTKFDSMAPLHQLQAGRLFARPFGKTLHLILISAVLALGSNFAGVAMAQGQSKSVRKQLAKLAPCLPADTSLDQIATYSPKRNVTVGEKLIELNARCVRGRVVGSNNKEIRFFHNACWGIPPPDYLEIQAEQKRKLAQLKKKYTVIVISCDPRIP